MNKYTRKANDLAASPWLVVTAGVAGILCFAWVMYLIVVPEEEKVFSPFVVGLLAVAVFGSAGAYTLVVRSRQWAKVEQQARFQRLAARWKAERGATSSITEMAMHPAYQEIIGMGRDALRFLLQELRRELDHWFWALKAIAAEDPVPVESRGNLEEMAQAWLEWGRAHRYVG